MLQSAPTRDLSCDVHPDLERVVVSLAGELDLAAAPQVEATLDDLLDAGFARIVVDLHELTFVDSAGIHALVAAHEGARRRGSTLSLVRGPRNVQRLFELTATDTVVSFDGPRAIR